MLPCSWACWVFLCTGATPPAGICHTIVTTPSALLPPRALFASFHAVWSSPEQEEDDRRSLHLLLEQLRCCSPPSGPGLDPYLYLQDRHCPLLSIRPLPCPGPAGRPSKVHFLQSSHVCMLRHSACSFSPSTTFTSPSTTSPRILTKFSSQTVPLPRSVPIFIVILIIVQSLSSYFALTKTTCNGGAFVCDEGLR